MTTPGAVDGRRDRIALDRITDIMQEITDSPTEGTQVAALHLIAKIIRSTGREV